MDEEDKKKESMKPVIYYDCINCTRTVSPNNPYMEDSEEDMTDWRTIEELHEEHYLQPTKTFIVSVCPECRESLKDTDIHYRCRFCSREVDDEEVMDVEKRWSVDKGKIMQTVVCKRDECQKIAKEYEKKR